MIDASKVGHFDATKDIDVDFSDYRNIEYQLVNYQQSRLDLADD